MKRHTLVAFAALAVSACATPSVSDAQDPLRAFPEAAAGQKRHVITLPAAPHEDGLKIEIIVGKTQRVDCNLHSLGGELREEVAQGWGYTYYTVSGLTGGASTRMGCPPGSDREAFVTLPQQTLVRYNSRLPLVIYAPTDAEVRYRVWTAGEVTPVE